MKLRIASLTVLILALAVIPASAQVLYDNGPINGTVDAWTINLGYVVSDSFTVSSATTVAGFDIGVWEYPGDTALTVDWSITSAEFGGTTYGSGTASVAQVFYSTNQYGYDIDGLSTGRLDPGVPLGAGTYWLNIQNVTSVLGDPVFWDENSGPSSASESAVGTIASEAFDIIATEGNTPEPSSIILFGSGIVGLAGLLRRKLF